MEYQNIVVLTGAGVSAESGLKTFRDNGGLWEGHRVEDVATPEAFAVDPAKVQKFYNQRRAQLQSNGVKCNAAHVALAEFEQRHAGSFALITQNVDNLHQRAGSQNVHAMHGELLKSRCLQCEKIASWSGDILPASTCAHCGESGCLRPHIVWFGEVPLYLDEISQALSQCDLFVAIGTSAAVYPAAGFYRLAADAGAKTVELNLVASDSAAGFNETHYGLATEIVPAFFSSL